MPKILPRQELRPWDRFLLTSGGPPATIVTVVGLLTLYCRIVFGRATDPVSSVLKVCSVICGCLVILACLACHLVDPGLPVPDPTDMAPADEHDDDLRIRDRCTPDGLPWRQKWCRECKLWRPKRCGHCHICQRCIMGLDHHCFWIGCCVGERNGRFFAIFLLSAGAGMICLVALGLTTIARLSWADGREPLLLLLFVCCCPPMPHNLCFGGGMLTSGGLAYSFALLTGMDLKNSPGNIESLRSEFPKLKTCPGAPRLCFGPVAWRRKSPQRASTELEARTLVPAPLEDNEALLAARDAPIGLRPATVGQATRYAPPLTPLHIGEGV